MIEQHLPAWLLAQGPWGLAWWQWVAVPALAGAALALGTVLSWLTRLVLARLAARTASTHDDELVGRLRGPLTALWSLLVATLAGPALDLGSAAEATFQRATRAGIFLALFWAGFRTLNVLFGAAGDAPWARQNPTLGGILPLFRKMSKFTLAALGVVAVLNELGFQVASLVAGLGIGGIALALAAQKTVENLFGSVAIGVDQPFRVGDLVKVDDFLGTVESIGMRSTRFRTPDRTLVTIPNGKLSDMKAETYGARDRIRLLATLGLVYSTRADQLRRVLAGLEAALREHPKVWPDNVLVRFTALGESALSIEAQAWFRTADWNEFTLIRQELLLRFLEIVEGAGTAFAFPTRTVVLDRGSADAAEPGKAASPGPAGVGK